MIGGVRAVGIDVAARRGLDVVTLDAHRRLVGDPQRVLSPTELEVVISELRPDVVAIDAPPAWRATATVRACERELLRRGLRLYVTPTAEDAGNAFYDWMRTGFDCFTAAARAGYRPYVGDNGFGGCVLEVFPHAVTVALRGHAPHPGAGGRTRARREWRAGALAAAGVDISELRTLDQIDAALAALTGLCALEGAVVAFGDATDGYIVLPRPTDRAYLKHL